MAETAVEMPPRMAKLPRDKHGRPVPWFVAWPDGQPDHRIARGGRFHEALARGACWVCGGHIGAYKSFVIGPMCAVNRVTSEPPSHRDCAVYSTRSCPFLTTPRMRRRDSGKPEGVVSPGGDMISRNPGVALVWTTKRYRRERVDNGVLLRIGDPTETLWFAEGREATRAEVLESIESGLPILRAIAQEDGPAAVTELEAMTAVALQLIPVTAVSDLSTNEEQGP